MLANQQAEERAQPWVKLWDHHKQGGLGFPAPPRGELGLPEHTADKVRAAALTYSPKTGLNFDSFNPRWIALQDDECVENWAQFFNKCQELLVWPLQWMISFQLFDKDDGGDRPIGLLPGPFRLWGRLTWPTAKEWIQKQDLSSFYGIPGKGSVQAAALSTVTSEIALANGKRWSNTI